MASSRRTRGRGGILSGESETERDQESDRAQYFVTVTRLVTVTDAAVTARGHEGRVGDRARRCFPTPGSSTAHYWHGYYPSRDVILPLSLLPRIHLRTWPSLSTPNLHHSLAHNVQNRPRFSRRMGGRGQACMFLTLSQHATSPQLAGMLVGLLEPTRHPHLLSRYWREEG